MQSRTALILGANGRLGRAVLEAFVAAGWQVLAQARRPIENLPPQARQLGIDMSNTEAVASAARDASIVVYAVNPSYTEWDEKLLPLARQGMGIAERLGALFMLPANVYGFGEKMPARLVESTMQRPTTKKGKQREALEEEMQKRIQRGLRGVVIRAGDFLEAVQATGSTKRSSSPSRAANLFTRARQMSSTPGPTCQIWRGRLSASPNSTSPAT